MKLVDASTQVAGNHSHGLRAKQSACGTWFYKPEVRDDERGCTERAFYDAHVEEAIACEAAIASTSYAERANAVEDSAEECGHACAMVKSTRETSEETLMALRMFYARRVPRCPAANAALDVNGYLRLENLTMGYERPCVIDLKIGMRTWDRKHAREYAEKRAKSDEGTTHGTLGFKLCGAQMFTADGRLIRLSRAQCKAIRTNETLTRELLEDFVRDPVTGKVHKWFWPALLRQLLSEPLWALRHRLVGSSLLVIYESGKLSPSTRGLEEAICVPESKLEARYIDFCHAVPKESADEVDENFEGGLRLFQRFVETMM